MAKIYNNKPENVAKFLRNQLKRQPAYLVGQSFNTAPQYLRDSNQKNVFMLRASGFNPDLPDSQADKLAWENTHMIFGITCINDKDQKSEKDVIENKRYILGIEGDVTELEVSKENWQYEKGKLTDKKWKNLQSLIEDWGKKGYKPVVSQEALNKDMANVPLSEQKSINEGSKNVGHLYTAMDVNAYSRYVSLRAPSEVLVTAFDLKRKQEAEAQQQESKLLAEQKTKEAAEAQNLINKEDAFTCPITLAIMQDPVRIKGFEEHAFERSAIEDWFFNKNKNTNPLTGEIVKDKTLEADPKLKKEIDDYVSAQANKYIPPKKK